MCDTYVSVARFDDCKVVSMYSATLIRSVPLRKDGPALSVPTHTLKASNSLP